MFHLTKNEKTVLWVLAVVILCGSMIHAFFKRFPAIDAKVSSPQRFVLRTNVNTASMEELIDVPYIGEKSAKAILEYRRKHGSFHSVDDLKKVPGVYPKNFVKMKPYLKL